MEFSNSILTLNSKFYENLPQNLLKMRIFKENSKVSCSPGKISKKLTSSTLINLSLKNGNNFSLLELTSLASMTFSESLKKLERVALLVYTSLKGKKILFKLLLKLFQNKPLMLKKMEK